MAKPFGRYTQNSTHNTTRTICVVKYVCIVSVYTYTALPNNSIMHTCVCLQYTQFIRDSSGWL